MWRGRSESTPAPCQQSRFRSACKSSINPCASIINLGLGKPPDDHTGRDESRISYTHGMIPLRDIIPSRTTPFVTVGILPVNPPAFCFEPPLAPPAPQILLREYRIVPATFAWSTLLSS